MDYLLTWNCKHIANAVIKKGLAKIAGEQGYELPINGKITMWTDPIVDELHKIRQANTERFNYDLDALFDYLKRQEKKGKRKVVRLPIKRRPVVQEFSTTPPKGKLGRQRSVLA
jgi:hypothetical protein